MNPLVIVAIIGAALAAFLVLRPKKKQDNQQQEAKDPFAMNDRIRGVQEWLEQTSVIPVFLVAVAAIVFKATFTYALGAVSVSDIPPDVLKFINFIVGAAIALLCETLATMAGRKWYVGWDAKLGIAERHAEASASTKKTVRHKDKDTGVVTEKEIDDPKAIRALNLMKKQQDRQQRENKVNFLFLVIGEAASFYAAMRYAFTSLGTTLSPDKWSFDQWNSFIQDSLVTLLILAGVFYIGVLFEPSKANDDDIASKGRSRLRFRLVNEAYTKVANNTYENKHVHMLMRGASPQERSELEAMLQSDRDAELWTTAQIAAWLGWTEATQRRDITRRINQAYKGNVEGIIHDPKKPKNWLVALKAVIEIFGQDFTEARAVSAGRTTIGQPSAIPLGAASDADPKVGHASDNHQTDDGIGTGQPATGQVIDGTATALPIDADDIETRIKALQEQVEYIERAAQVALENDPYQDVDALAKRWGMPAAHLRVIRDEMLRAQRGLPTPTEEAPYEQIA